MNYKKECAQVNPHMMAPMRQQQSIQKPAFMAMYLKPFVSNKALMVRIGVARKKPVMVPCNAPCLNVR